jgi:pimeloyl-ACP methyl ester carboxylesterase
MKVHILIQITSAVLILYLAYCSLLFLFQRQILFPRNQVLVPSGMAKNIPGMEKTWLQTSYGKVEAWFLPPVTDRDTEPAAAVIFAHGNAELIDFWPEEFSNLTRFGIGVLLVEYPGYGRSQGPPSQKTTTEAFVAAYDALVARKDVDPSRIVLFGRSLGGGAVCELAARRPSAALILLSTFTSVRSLASRFLVPGFFVRDRFDNLAVVSSYSNPVLVIHGSHDSLIPYKHGVALYRAAQHGQMLTYECQHNDCPPNWNRFWQDVQAFLHHAGIIALH